ncbi:hypothetical protein [Mammaliicoccus stepanovicii]|uniref:Uncharacterized protein n=1 Tax=Mammaliicoccus stepanovicii TaxID=643214 RepID=A0A239YPE2_9STAP|nr:hypothetical protein [Mammaliicoccus stepanovicii]PNZ74250.1 hypothetical protein CD111_09065 [Mammaliicoccus stepanovicii]GGI41185.1 hypothetical protein GCM10010896_12100 [Mammaliicoccus stepanovicii]SNV60118.1 Uncharacterised protein [Mammaliicoccus stepanovicii]
MRKRFRGCILKVTLRGVKQTSNDKELTIEVELEIWKKRHYKDKFNDNMDANFFARLNDDMMQQAAMSDKNEKVEQPTGSYFEHNSHYKGKLRFIFPKDMDFKNGVEIAYLDIDGHHFKELILPVKLKS